MSDLSFLLNRNAIYNKYVAIECGIIASCVFSSILSYVKTNDINGKGKIAYASSPVLEKLFPEFTAHQIRKALLTLKNKDYIELKNKNENVQNEFDFVISLKYKGATIYKISSDMNLIAPLFKPSYKKKEYPDEE